MHYTLRQLRAAQAVAHHGSFRRAADAVSLSQPALSLAVSELEGVLGVTLFDRTSRMVRPTVVGEAFFSSLGRSLSNLDALVKEVGMIAQSRRGQVVISSIASVAGRLMPNVLMECANQFPEVELTLRDDVASRVVEVVRYGEADFGIVAKVEGSLPEDLIFEKIVEEPFYLVCVKNHRLARKRSVMWSELDNESYVSFTTASGANAVADQQVLLSGVKFSRVFSASQLSTVHAMLEAPLGIGILPRLGLPTEHHPNLTYRPLVRPVLNRTLGVVRRKDRSYSPAAAAVKDILMSVARAKVRK
ncbi:MAG: LysR family transcriptional regulator [Comamonadaceae bacterium]|nr:LysR family transcriptional regulator [Comamonadaceae bacterium]